MKKHDPSLEQNGSTRRDFVRKAAYVAPLILTLPAAPAFAQVGSAAGCSGVGDDQPLFDLDGNFFGCGS